jgi:hypothetical protein
VLGGTADTAFVMPSIAARKEERLVGGIIRCEIRVANDDLATK